MKFRGAVMILMIVTISGCFANKSPEPPASGFEQEKNTGSTQIMRTSFYGKGDGFNGKPTASGEKFSPSGLTAAHRSLPFGTLLELTNPKNGKVVVVRINDRGPFVKGHSLDISLAAAQKLGLTKDGVEDLQVRNVTQQAPAKTLE